VKKVFCMCSNALPNLNDFRRLGRTAAGATGAAGGRHFQAGNQEGRRVDAAKQARVDFALRRVR
jgi:hypothetical protein